MSDFISEMAGTGMLVLLGDGVVGGVILNKCKAQNSGWVAITMGWGIAVTVGVFVAMKSGAHINPAVTVGLAAGGMFPWSKVPLFVLAQMVGAMIGAILVWLAYLSHWEATEDSATKLAVFSTGPAIRNYGKNLITEIIGTFVLVFGVLAIVGTLGSEPVMGSTLPFAVGFLVLGIGLSLGGPTGYAINPARDLGPRIMHSILPVAGKGGSDWSYSWVPVVGPIIGGVLGALLFKVLF